MVSEPVLSFVKRPRPVMVPLSGSEPGLAMNVGVEENVPVQIDAPLALNAPPGLAELIDPRW